MRNEPFPIFNTKLPCSNLLEQQVCSTECGFDIRSALSTNYIQLAQIIAAYCCEQRECKIAPVLNAARHVDVWGCWGKVPRIRTWNQHRIEVSGQFNAQVASLLLLRGRWERGPQPAPRWGEQNNFCPFPGVGHRFPGLQTPSLDINIKKYNVKTLPLYCW